MKNSAWIITFVLSAIHTTHAQPAMKTYEGGWQGMITNDRAFHFEVRIEEESTENYRLHIGNDHPLIEQRFTAVEQVPIEVNIDNRLKFRGTFAADRQTINGFMESGLLQYHVRLEKQVDGAYTGSWNILMTEQLLPPAFYLSVENVVEDTYEAYPVFADDRFTGTWCLDFEKSGDSIFFRDMKTGLRFCGSLAEESIVMDIWLGKATITRVPLERSVSEWNIGTPPQKVKADYRKPAASGDGWDVATLKEVEMDEKMLQKMIRDITSGTLPNTHSVLISRNGKLVFEHYFAGYDATIPHDMRSASKSLASAVTGIAIDRKSIENARQRLYDLLPGKYQYTRDEKGIKGDILLHHLLTMSSGLDALDFGVSSGSAASEDTYQGTPDWTRTILEAPMIHEPGVQANYGSANPYLLGVALDSAIVEPMSLFMDRHLFQPLGIYNYIVQNDLEGRPYFGGGMYMTPRDMLKFGQLYLNKGTWQDKTILSRRWVENSLLKHSVLENTKDKNGYGYLWWHGGYVVNGKHFHTLEARGAGGQYIVLVPDIDLAVVITSGNYRNGKFAQPEQILEGYILPAVTMGKE